MSWVRPCCLAAASAIAMEPLYGFAGSLDPLTDLTGRVQAIVTLKSRDNFTSEYRYDVSVRNLSPDAIIGDSLVIVLDKITNLAGDDREGLTGESFLKRFDVLDQDGQTDDGKPYFRIPAGASSDLISQTDSLPVVVLASNGRQDSAGQCATCCDFPLHLVEAKSASCLSLLEGCVPSGLSARKSHNTRSFDITPRHRSRNAGWASVFPPPVLSRAFRWRWMIRPTAINFALQTAIIPPVSMKARIRLLSSL